MAQVTELITKFGFEGSASPLDGYNESLSKGIGLLAGFAASVIATSTAITAWASSTIEAEQPLIDLAAATDVAVERIQELNYIASVSNSSSEALGSSLEGLATKIGEAAQKGNDDFSRLGVSVRTSNGYIKDTDTVLTEVGNRFKALGLSASEQKSFAEALGIDASLLTMLNRTSGEMDMLAKRARELGVLNEKQILDAQEYNDSLTTLRFGMDGIRRLIAVGLAPEMKGMIDTFADILVANKDWIVNGITTAIEVIGDLMDLIVRLSPIIAAATGLFVAFKVATLGLSGALALLLSPAILIAAGIAAIILVVDDLMVAMNGGKSIIADFFMEFLGFDIVPFLNGWLDLIIGFFTSINDFGKGLIDSFLSIFSGLKNILSGNFSEAWDDILSGFTSLIASFNHLVPNWIKGLFGGGVEVGIDQSAMPGAGVTNNTQTGGDINQDVRIEIRSTEPARAGAAVSDSLQEQMTDARNQARRGGM